MPDSMLYDPQRYKYLICDRAIAEVVVDILESPADFGIPDDIPQSERHAAAILLASRMKRHPGTHIVDTISDEINDRREIDRLKADKFLTHSAACLTHALTSRRKR